MSQELLDALREALPGPHQKLLSPEGPAPMRAMAAKGMAPLPPKDMIVAVCGLSLSDDGALAETATATLEGFPDKILLPAIQVGLPDVALQVLAPRISARETVVEAIILRRETPDDVVAQFAEAASESIAEIISGNQERCLRSQAIVAGLRRNSALLKSSSDRLFDFLARSGVIYDDMPEFADALARLSPTERQAMAENIELPPEVNRLLVDPPDAAKEDESESKNELETAEIDAKAMPMLKLVASLSVSQKVGLALKGNKEARTILVRDSNKVVSSAAIKSPRITEQEVVTAAKSRSVSDEVIRIISNSKDMTRSYTVKMALVNNPKTPQGVSFRFLTLLRAADLKGVAKSKNVPGAVATHAKRLLAKKKT